MRLLEASPNNGMQRTALHAAADAEGVIPQRNTE